MNEKLKPYVCTNCLRPTSSLASGFCGELILANNSIASLEEQAEVARQEFAKEIKSQSDLYEKQLLKKNEKIEKLIKALKAQIQMRNFKTPTKLIEELSWGENDDLANKWTEEALE
jgi:hypothetical protein